MSASQKMITALERASWVRKMFEEGAARKEKYGPENVFDFSLGNPNLDPPEKLKEIVGKLLLEDTPGRHGYMPNAGILNTRKAVAQYLRDLNHHSFGPEDIIMTVGAAGALNVLLKALLNPDDEVIVPKPYFMEYNFYIDNNGGVPMIVNTRTDFSLDIESIEKAIGPKTRVVLINNPNNPTGKLYSKTELDDLGKVLTRMSDKYGETIYLISDEPYSKILFNGSVCPSIFDAYRESILATSFSKDLSLAGERIGYIAMNPEISEKNTLIDLFSLCNRILGYVNAPALMQRAMPFLLNDKVDVGLYEKKRNLLSKGLREAGYDFVLPDGTFYLFPKSPIPDDVEFVHALQEENILTVPGSAFGGPGYFRIAYCVTDQTIHGALPGFARSIKKYR